MQKTAAASFWRDLDTGAGARTLGSGMRKLWLDGKVEASLDTSVEHIGATEAWRGGLTGKGVTVAVLDSGYDTEHPDLKRSVRTAKGFTDEDTVEDGAGHGTHVASTIAGSGAASDGRYEGSPTVRIWRSARYSTTTARGMSPGSSPGWSGRHATRTPRW